MLNLKNFEYYFDHEDELDEIELQLAKTDILSFTTATKPDYEINWHHQLLADKLNAFARGEIQYLMIFMPPRHGKSELVSRRFPAFLHGLYPDAEIMAASYLDTLAADMCMAVQSIIDTYTYQQIFPNTKILPPRSMYTRGIRNSLEHTIIGHRGRYLAAGVGGSFTGKGANYVLIDDPIKGREVADSLAFRDRLWKFWLNDLYSRLETSLKTGQKGQALITQTRWHEDDLSGRLIEIMKKNPLAMQWEILSLPAIKTDITYQNDPRQIGEALWPNKYDVKKLEEIRETLTTDGGVRAWSSLYQQNPTPEGGGKFKDKMFEICDVPGAYDWVFITADTAYKEKQRNDYTVFSVWGVIKGQLYLIDLYRKQIASDEVEAQVEPFIMGYVKYGFRGTWIEPKGHGIYLNQVFAKKKVMIPHEKDAADFYSDRRLDKVERANNVVPHLANKKVYISRAIAQKEEIIAEALGFPNWTHDDFVDTLIDALKMVYSKTTNIFELY